jgi:hypothetical protein
MAHEIDIPSQVEERPRETAREEAEGWQPHRQRQWSPESMRAAMARLRELRKRMVIPEDELEALLEEHRREIGRGPPGEE